MEISAIALQGVEQAQAQFEQAATQFAGSTSDPLVDTVDLSQAAVAVLSAKNDFAANIQMVKTANDMQKQILDLFA